MSAVSSPAPPPLRVNPIIELFLTGSKDLVAQENIPGATMHIQEYVKKTILKFCFIFNHVEIKNIREKVMNIYIFLFDFPRPHFLLSSLDCSF